MIIRSRIIIMCGKEETVGRCEKSEVKCKQPIEDESSLLVFAFSFFGYLRWCLSGWKPPTTHSLKVCGMSDVRSQMFKTNSQSKTSPVVGVYFSNFGNRRFCYTAESHQQRQV